MVVTSLIRFIPLRACTRLIIISVGCVLLLAVISWVFGETGPNDTTVNIKQTSLSWARCQRLITGAEKTSSSNKREPSQSNSDIYNKYLHKSCHQVLRHEFAHPTPTEMELNFPIAYGIFIYNGPALFEKLLHAIYMPQNVYCIHIDTGKSKYKYDDGLYRTVKQMISCLPNVFIARKRVNVVWGDITLVDAILGCLDDLQKHKIHWKYFIYMVGQDFPLYSNREIVRALMNLNGSNNIESFPMPENNKFRTLYVYKEFLIGKKKSPPPHNISIQKGNLHGIFSRAFAEYLLKSNVARDFLTWCRDTKHPDETYFASLQNHAMTPGGIQGQQPETIPKVIRWQRYDKKPSLPCHGGYVRHVCWLDILDLHWVLAQNNTRKLFAHKIPFDFGSDLLDCLSLSLENRIYPL